MRSLIERFAKDESGATAIEYGLLAALIAVAAIVGMNQLGTGLKTIFNGVGNKLANTTVP